MTWLPTQSTTLDSLLDIVNAPAEAEPPWRAGFRLEFSSFGGIRSLENRSIGVALEDYTSNVRGNLTQEITANYDSDFANATSYRFARDDELLDGQEETQGDTSFEAPEANWGTDSLSVTGPASFRFHERLVLMTGTVTKQWMGGVVRFAGTEGIICGGVFTRVFAGPSVHLSALATGDVYGGAARVSAARIHIAGFGYRSSDLCNWAAGFSGRFTNITLIPGVPVPPKQGRVAKALGKAYKLAGALLPFVEIIGGILMFLKTIVMLLASLVKWIGRMGKKALTSMLPGVPAANNQTAVVHENATADETIA